MLRLIERLLGGLKDGGSVRNSSPWGCFVPANAARWGRRWSGDTGKDGLCYGEQGIKVEMFITVASLAEVLITILDSHATWILYCDGMQMTSQPVLPVIWIQGLERSNTFLSASDLPLRDPITKLAFLPGYWLVFPSLCIVRDPDRWSDWLNDYPIASEWVIWTMPVDHASLCWRKWQQLSQTKFNLWLSLVWQ